MKKPVVSRRLLAAAVACLLVVPSLVAQQRTAVGGASARASVVPPLVNFNGVLRDANGKAVSSVSGVTFLLYRDSEGATPVWVETQNVAPDKSGHYTVQLGATLPNGLPQELFVSGEARWLGVQPEGQPEQPRVLLLSVPYALKAGDAETLGGVPLSAFVLATPQGAKPAATADEVSTTAAPPTNAAVTGAGTISFIPLWDTTSDIVNSALSQTGTGTTAKIGVNNTAPTSTLDVKGSSTVRGTLTLPPTSAATATAGKASQPLNLIGSSFNSGTATAVNQTFRLQTEPVGNNTATTSGALSLLYATGTGAATETGLKIASNGQITFASGQLFPGTGAGTITGVTAGSGLIGGGTSGNISLSLPTTCAANQILKWSGSAWACSADSNSGGTIGGVTAGTALTGGGTSGTVTLNVDTSKVVTALVAGTDLTGGGTGGAQTLNLDTTKVPQLNTPNTFVGNQSVVGNSTASGTVSASIVNAGYFTLGGSITPFAQGSILSNNAFLGFAGNSTTAGTNNVAVGPDALFAVTSGSSNTAAGQNALIKNTTGSSNLAQGAGALGNNTSGGSNTALGGVALTSNVTGSYNTGIGYGAGPDPSSTGLTEATAIGAFATVSKSNALALGGTGANAVSVGIGTATPNSTLDVRGTANFTGLITFASGQTFPGAGTITGVTAGPGLTGGGTTGNVTLSLDTTKVPELSTANTYTGNQTVNANLSATGTVSAGSYQIGNNLFGFGDAVNNNVYLGFAGNKTTTSYGNTGVGGQALAVNAGGTNNTATGQAALASNVSGIDNIAVGVDALVDNKAGSYNSATGVSALWNTTGNYNTASGYGALYSNSTGTNNTALGANTNVGAANLIYATAIGAGAVVSESNAMALGGTGAAAVKVGIGTATPAYELHVNGAIRGETGLLLGGNAPVYVDAPGVVGGRFTILANGSVGINNNNPQSTLDVGGSLRIGGDTPMSSNPRMSFSGMFPGSFCGDIECGNTSGCSGAYCAGPGGYFVPDRNILITRMTVIVANTVDPSCYALPSIEVITPGNGYSMAIQTSNIVDSGPISVPVSGGAPVTIISSQTFGCNLGTSGGGGAFVNVQYVMQ